MRVPMKNARFGCRAAARQRKGVATIAAARPKPWLMLFAISSRRVWVQFAAANNSSITLMRLPRRASPSHNTIEAQVKSQMHPIKAIFFDAAGTLIHLPRTVGHHYSFVARRIGLRFDAAALDTAFTACWKQMPVRAAIAGPREDDDKGWWRELVNRV